MSKRLWATALSVALVVGGGCKKDEDAGAKKPVTNEKKVDKTPPPPPKPAPLTGAEMAKWYQDCWGHWNAGAWDKFEACYAADAVSTQVDSGMPDAVGAKAIVEASKPYRTAFPDMKGELQLVLVNGRTIFAVAWLHGSHTGPLASPMGEIPATGKKLGVLAVHGVTISDDNKVTREWFFQDAGTMMAQLGLSPAPGRPVMEKGMDGAPVVVIAADNDVEKANVAAWQKGLDAFNKHDVAGVMADYADDMVESDLAAPEDVKGKKDIQKGMEAFFKGFSDIKIETTTPVWGAGDYIVSVGVLSGTNDGDMPMMKMKATKKPVKLSFVEIGKFEGGKIKQVWRLYNGMAFMMQIAPEMMAPPKGGEAPKKGP